MGHAHLLDILMLPKAQVRASALRVMDLCMTEIWIAPPLGLWGSHPEHHGRHLTFEAISYQAKGLWTASGRTGAIRVREVYAGGPPLPGGRVA